MNKICAMVTRQFSPTPALSLLGKPLPCFILERSLEIHVWESHNQIITTWWIDVLERLLFISLYPALCINSINVTPAYNLMPVVIAKAEQLLELYINPSPTRLGSSKPCHTSGRFPVVRRKGLVMMNVPVFFYFTKIAFAAIRSSWCAWRPPFVHWLQLVFWMSAHLSHQEVEWMARLASS